LYPSLRPKRAPKAYIVIKNRSLTIPPFPEVPSDSRVVGGLSDG